MEEKQSEFGKGITYCLGLFLCHIEKFNIYEPADPNIRDVLARTWFYGSTDHLYEINETNCSDEINKMITELKDFAFDRRNNLNGTREDILKCKRRALDILMKIDAEVLHTDVVRGDYE